MGWLDQAEQREAGFDFGLGFSFDSVFQDDSGVLLNAGEVALAQDFLGHRGEANRLKHLRHRLKERLGFSFFDHLAALGGGAHRFLLVASWYGFILPTGLKRV